MGAGRRRTERQENNDNKKQLQTIPSSIMHGGYQTGKCKNFLCCTWFLLGRCSSWPAQSAVYLLYLWFTVTMEEYALATIEIGQCTSPLSVPCPALVSLPLGRKMRPALDYQWMLNDGRHLDSRIDQQDGISHREWIDPRAGCNSVIELKFITNDRGGQENQKRNSPLIMSGNAQTCFIFIFL